MEAYLRFEILANNDIVRGGYLDIQLSEVGDIYDCRISVEIRCGKKVFGAWVPLPSFKYEGSSRVPAEKLSEEFVMATQKFRVDDIEFEKAADDEHMITFAADNGNLRGWLLVGYDGLDPVEIQKIDMSYDGYDIEAVAT